VFERNKAAESTVAQLMDLAADYCRGQMLLFEDLERVAGVPRTSGRWSLILHKFRTRLLRERKVALLPKINVGYKLATHDEQLNFLPEQRQRKASRQLHRATEEVGALPPEELNTHQRRVQGFRLQSITTARLELLSQARQQHVLAGATQGHPVPRATPGVTAE
jgi:hypothetical protein